MDAISLLQQLKSGAETPAGLVSASLARIEKENPKLNAASEVLTSDAQKQLQNLPPGALHGLPISVKECYAIAGKKITSGSKRMKPIVCDEDATVVKRLKNAGAVIVSRGNTSEFLLGRETDNLLVGTTNNVFNSNLTAGGSSGGEGSLVASECVAFGIGTDIGGSVRYPALFNGVVGFKPASGQIDKKGIFPVASNTFTDSMNSPGVICRSVRDARLVYNVIADKQLVESSNVNAQIFTSANFKLDIKDETIKRAYDRSVEFFSKKQLPDKDLDISESGQLYTDFVTLICAGFTDKVYEWSVTEDGKKLSVPAEFFRRLRGKPTISNEIFALLPAFNLYKPSASKLQKTIERVESLRKKYYSVLGSNGILILPTAGVLAPQHKKFVKMYNKPGVIGSITPVSFCNTLNLSCVTVPAFKFQKDKTVNPPGIQLVSAPGNEELLLNTAQLLEGELN
jgi:Asp-tRNA(Asn)/Glu-tRNA(Gln) amidotransferase A subunit family amidase